MIFSTIRCCDLCFFSLCTFVYFVLFFTLLWLLLIFILFFSSDWFLLRFLFSLSRVNMIIIAEIASLFLHSIIFFYFFLCYERYFGAYFFISSLHWIRVNLLTFVAFRWSHHRLCCTWLLKWLGNDRKCFNEF